MTCKSAFLHLLLIPLATACASESSVLDLAELQGEAGVRTDSAQYHLLTTEGWHELTIGVSYTNRTPVEVQIPTCHSPYPPLLEKLGPDGWTLAYNPPVLMCLGPPVSIRPGEEYRMTYRVIAGRHPNQYPQFEVEPIAGTYRINWTALHTSRGTLPENHRTSSPFGIRQ